MIVYVSNKKMIYSVFKGFNDVEEKLIDVFMPGPFTIILEKSRIVSDVALCKMNTIGVRMPSNKIINAVINNLGIPILAPSANISGRLSGTNVSDIIDEFNGRVDFIVDGGDCDIGIESTVVKVVDEISIILRPGYITEDDIRNVVGNVKLSDNLLKKLKMVK